MFDFESNQIQYDNFGNRILQCLFCGRAYKEQFFVVYGGKSRINKGICRNCDIHENYLKLNTM